MRRLRFGLLVLIVLLVASAGIAARTAAAQPTIDPRVLEDTANGQTGHFLVLLRQQAKVRARASQAPDRVSQGRVVMDALRGAANASQGPVRAQLDALGAKQRAFWIVNLLAVEGNRAAVDAMAARSDVLEIESDRAFRAPLETAEATYVLGGAADTWGRTWIAANLSNASLRVRVSDVASGGGTTSRDFSLDWVAVRVSYQ